MRFGYVYPPDRKWLIGSFLQLLRKFAQPSLFAVHLDVLERLADEAREMPSADLVPDGRNPRAISFCFILEFQAKIAQ